MNTLTELRETYRIILATQEIEFNNLVEWYREDEAGDMAEILASEDMADLKLSKMRRRVQATLKREWNHEGENFKNKRETMATAKAAKKIISKMIKEGNDVYGKYEHNLMNHTLTKIETEDEFKKFISAPRGVWDESR